MLLGVVCKATSLVVIIIVIIIIIDAENTVLHFVAQVTRPDVVQ